MESFIPPWMCLIHYNTCHNKPLTVAFVMNEKQIKDKLLEKQFQNMI